MVYRLLVQLLGGVYAPEWDVERTLEIDGSMTLEDLTWGILDSLDFDFDHLYEYQIDGRHYDGAPPFASRSERCLDQLSSLGLKKRKKFLLLYDWGDDWQFRITVQDILDRKGGAAKLIAASGMLDQYPNTEDWGGGFVEDWEDDWEDPELLGTEMVDWSYTPPDALFDAAFRYKKTKLWKQLSEKELFAIRCADGTVAYLSIMGIMGEHCSIGVYLGEEGVLTWRKLITQEPPRKPFFMAEFWASQNCLQLILDRKDELNDEEIEAARAYGKRNGVRFAGANAYPHFWKYLPAHLPWHPVSTEEEEYLIEAADACITLSEMLKSHTPVELGIKQWDPLDSPSVPLMARGEDGWFFDGTVTLPRPESDKYPSPSVIDGITAGKLKKIKKEGSLECCLVMHSSVIQDVADGQPYNPYILLAVDGDNGFVYQPVIVGDFYAQPDKVVNELLAVLLEMKCHPKVIRVCDERTCSLLSPACELLGTKLEVVEDLPCLEPVMIGLFL